MECYLCKAIKMAHISFIRNVQKKEIKAKENVETIIEIASGQYSVFY